MILRPPTFNPAIYRHDIRGRIVSPSAPPVISGFAYPANVLTSTRAGQWFVNDIAVIGETGSTYTVRLTDIGLPIRCGNSNVLTCWHPNQIAAVNRFWWAARNALNSVSPDVLATDGQTVRRWSCIISGAQANQASAPSQPIWRSAGQSGNPSIQFDGVNDILAAGSSDLFQNRSNGYIFAGLRDTNLTGGFVNHVATSFQSGDNQASRLNVATRTGGSDTSVATRRVDGGGDSITTRVPSNSNYNVHTAEALWSSNILNHRINGAQVGTTNTGGAGNTSNTVSPEVNIGAFSTIFSYFPGHITCIICANPATPLSATDRSRIERFIGLMGGLNIPLV